MQAKMGTSLTYRHEDGINFNAVLPDLVVGSCLQGPEDADRLADAGVTTVFSLQVRDGSSTLAARCRAAGRLQRCSPCAAVSLRATPAPMCAGGLRHGVFWH